MVRSLPRASAGLSRLAASPVPAAPPAPTSVCASSMNRMIGFGDACTSSITWRRRFSNSPFMLAPACSRPTSSARSETSFSGGGTSPRGDAQREALDDRRLADARLAGEDRVVLAAPHQDVDDLADLLVAADDRIDLALARALGQVDRELASAPPACPSRPAPSRRCASPGAPAPAPVRRRAAPSRASRSTIASNSSVSLSTLIFSNSREMASSALRSRGVLSDADHQVAGAHLAVAEHQGAVDPAALDRLLDVRRQVGDRRRAARQPVERLGDVPGQRATDRAGSARTMRCRSESCCCRIWWNQCTSSTYGLPRSLQKTVALSIALYPRLFSFPNKRDAADFGHGLLPSSVLDAMAAHAAAVARASRPADPAPDLRAAAPARRAAEPGGPAEARAARGASGSSICSSRIRRRSQRSSSPT